MKQTFAKGYKAGVKIAFGTDSGVSPHGENAREFVLMVEGGMPPMKAIQSATIEGARLLRIDSMLGSLEPTKLADIIATEGNPIEDISCMSQISFVMKEGKSTRSPSPSSTPTRTQEIDMLAHETPKESRGLHLGSPS